MHTSKNQKSSWFLTIVAFVMVLFWVGYIFSCLSWSETFATNNNENISPYAENIHIKDLQWKEDQEKTFAGVERSVAERAVSWWNKLVGNNDSTSSLVVNLPENGNDTTLWDKVASWYEDTSTTNVAWNNMQLGFANGYILPSVYQDISTSSYQDAITILYSNGIVQSNNKFYPHNYVRVSDFIRVVMDAYRVQLWYEPSSLVGLTTNFYFSDSSFDSEVMKRVNSAYELWFLQSFALKDAEWNLRLNAFITPQEAKNILWEIKNKHSDSIKNIPNLSWQSEETLRKDEMAELVVSAFDLKLNEWSLAVFSDISWSAYQQDIQLLAKLGIVWWVDGKFYPNAKIENKDFVIMIVRALMRQSDSQPTISNFYYLTNLLNASYTSPYSPYLEFCLESQTCNSLLSQTQNWVSFDPSRTLSRWEVTSVLSTISKKQLIIAWDTKQLITRWEVAKLIVDSFKFNNEGDWPTNLTMSNWWNQKSDSSKALSSLWTNFQDMMKIS
jgi:hypothetical protein